MRMQSIWGDSGANYSCWSPSPDWPDPHLPQLFRVAHVHGPSTGRMEPSVSGGHSATSQERKQGRREQEAHLCLLLLLTEQSLFSPICLLIALGRGNISTYGALAVMDVGRGWELLL